ncbi:MAG TPA: hypothetical protein VL426_01850 [Candidatus Binatia bacterium]|jgi:hypothetical protein|nr:hypothetical protein [Candidatus Binatia bacterium]
MKVVKEGKWNVPWSGEYGCRTCEAVLHLDEADVKPTDNRSNEFYFVCPVCGKTTEVPAKDLPLRVKETLEKKRKYWSSGDPW